jgi:hypothetical protein
MNAFTLAHVLLSLVGLAAGLVVLGGWMGGRTLPRWTALFLAATVLTNVTGFFFPFHGVTPGIVVGVLSLLLLALAIYALAAQCLAGRWRTIYVVTAHTALYFNFFVLVAQLFQHTPALTALAPTQSEPPFAVAQGLVLLLFIALGVAAVRGFRSAAGPR